MISCFVCLIAADVSFTVSAKFARALPSVICRYFSLKTSYFVLMIFAVVEIFSAGNSTETVSHSPHRSKSAYCSYSGLCHRFSKETVMLIDGTSKPLVSTQFCAFVRSCSTVISVAPLKLSEKSLIQTRSPAAFDAFCEYRIFSGSETVISSGSVCPSVGCVVYFA